MTDGTPWFIMLPAIGWAAVLTQIEHYEISCRLPDNTLRILTRARTIWRKECAAHLLQKMGCQNLCHLRLLVYRIRGGHVDPLVGRYEYAATLKEY